MNTERFIAKRIISDSQSSKTLSRPIVRISIIGISLGLAVMILAVGIVKGFQNEIKSKLIGLGAHITITNYDNNVSAEPKPVDRNQSTIVELEKIKNIKHISVFATKNGIIKTKTDNEGILLKGIDTDYDWSFVNKNIVEGKSFLPSDTVSKNIVVSTLLCKKLNLKLNDKMIIYFIVDRFDSSGVAVRTESVGKDFYISGIYETGFEDIDKTLVLTDIRRIQKMNGWNKNQVAGFELAIDDYKKIDFLGEEMNEKIGSGLVAQTIKQLNPTVFSWLELQDINALIVIVLMIVVAGINMISALLILILERTSMIGILKSLGSTNKSVQKIFLYNAIFLISKGLLWGNVLGLGIAFIQKQFGVFKLDKAQYYVTQIPMDINIFSVLLLNIGTLACCIIMLLFPSLIISRITPVKSLRFS